MARPPPRRRRTAAASALPAGVAASLAACSPAPAPAPHSAASAAPAVVIPAAPASASASAAPPPAPDPADATAALRPYAVTHARPARRVLYTWTTREQIEELARDRVLLTRATSPEHGPSIYDQVVSERAEGGDRLARILRGPKFLRARFAWPAPWATLLGWAGETYGDSLLRVELRPDAWIAKLISGRPGWDVVDLDDRPVPLEEALRRPDRIAAVYFVQEASSARMRGTYLGTYLGTFGAAQPPWPYREYVICNEAMVASWSTGTGAIARELESGAAALTALRRHLAAEPPRPPEDLRAWTLRLVGSVWPGPEPEPTPLAHYEAALAFPNAHYVPSPDQLSALARRLRALAAARGAPALTHTPAPPP